MTAHLRTKLRNAVKARLESSGAFETVCGDFWLAGQWQQEEFPAAAVSVLEASRTRDTGGEYGERETQRDFVVRVLVGLQIANFQADDELDALAMEAEKALVDPDELGIGALAGWEYAGADEPVAKLASLGIAALPITWRCSVYTTDGNPETNLNT